MKTSELLQGPKFAWILLLFIILNFISFKLLLSQNVGINTTGAAPNLLNMLEVLSTNTTNNSVGLYGALNANTIGTGYAFQAVKTGTATTANVAGYFSATGATNNYAIIIPSNGGRVGIGTSSPTALLDVTQTVTASGIIKGINYSGAINTNQTSGNEISSISFTTAGRQWATGAIALQREVLITQPTYSFVGASTITNAANLAIAGAPIKSTNATITNTHGILIQAGAVSTAVSSYGLTVNAQTGATNNYSATFLGGNVGIGTASPSTNLEVAGQVKITGGTPGAGKVLTSDAAGLSTWQTPSPSTGSVILLYNDETSSSFTNTTSSVKTWTIVGTYSQIKVEADIEYDNTGSVSNAGYTYDLYYNGVIKRTATLKCVANASGNTILSGYISYTGAISNGQVVKIDVTKLNTPTTGYVHNFRVYGIQ